MTVTRNILFCVFCFSFAAHAYRPPKCQKAMEAFEELMRKKIRRRDLVSIISFSTIVGFPVGIFFWSDGRRKEAFIERSRKLLTALKEADLSDTQAKLFREDQLKNSLKDDVKRERKKDLELLNEERKLDGLAPLSDDEYEDQYPFIDDLEEAFESTPFRWMLIDPMREISETMNWYSKEKIQRSEVRAFLAKHRDDDYFCPNGKAQRLKRRYWKGFVRDLLEARKLGEL